MPLSVEEFLAVEPQLRVLRYDLAYCPPEAARREAMRIRLAELTAELARLWAEGAVGWMTSREAQQVAAELVADAKAKRLHAHAAVHGDRLVLSGAACGARPLPLASTSPVRARLDWVQYLTTCSPAPRPRFWLGGLRGGR